MAWALMAGFGYPDFAQRDARRRLSLSQRRHDHLLVTPQTGATVKLPNVSQDFRIGIRYMAN